MSSAIFINTWQVGITIFHTLVPVLGVSVILAQDESYTWLRSGLCTCVCLCRCGHVLLEYTDLCGAVSLLLKDIEAMANRVAGSLALHQTAIFC